MLTSDMWGDILRFVVREYRDNTTTKKKFKKISEKLLTDVWQIW